MKVTFLIEDKNGLADVLIGFDPDPETVAKNQHLPAVQLAASVLNFVVECMRLDPEEFTPESILWSKPKPPITH